MSRFLPVIEFLERWGAYMSGGASVIAAFYSAFVEAVLEGRWVRVSLWMFAYICLALTAWSFLRDMRRKLSETEAVFSREREQLVRERNALEERLRPQVEILPEAERDGRLYRVRVRLLSDVGGNLCVYLVRVNPAVPLMPSMLRLQPHGRPGQEEMDVPGKVAVAFDVCRLMDPVSEGALEFIGTDWHGPGAPHAEYELAVVASLGGILSPPRTFRVRPQGEAVEFRAL
jgi:hypothetical protein